MLPAGPVETLKICNLTSTKRIRNIPETPGNPVVTVEADPARHPVSPFHPSYSGNFQAVCGAAGSYGFAGTFRIIFTSWVMTSPWRISGSTSGSTAMIRSRVSTRSMTTGRSSESWKTSTVLRRCSCPNPDIPRTTVHPGNPFLRKNLTRYL